MFMWTLVCTPKTNIYNIYTSLNVCILFFFLRCFGFWDDTSPENIEVWEPNKIVSIDTERKNFIQIAY